MSIHISTEIKIYCLSTVVLPWGDLIFVKLTWGFLESCLIVLELFLTVDPPVSRSDMCMCTSTGVKP